MPNIISTEEVGWKTSDYIDTKDEEGNVHQHLVKVADYVAGPGEKSEMARAEGEKTSIGAYEYAPGGWITDHLHHSYEQWYYIISGKALMKVGDEEKVVERGYIVFIPRNTVHSYKVIGDEPLRFLNVGTLVEGSKYDGEVVHSTE